MNADDSGSSRSSKQGRQEPHLLAALHSKRVMAASALMGAKMRWRPHLGLQHLPLKLVAGIAQRGSRCHFGEPGFQLLCMRYESMLAAAKSPQSAGLSCLLP